MKTLRSIFALALATSVATGCATDVGDDTEELDTLEETVPGRPKAKADRVDWENAAKYPSLTPNSDYMRAQSLMVRLSQIAYKDDDTAFRERAWCGDLVKDENGVVTGCNDTIGFYGVKSVHHEAGGLGKGDADAWFGTTQAGSMGFIVVRGTKGRGDKLTDLFSAPTAPSDIGGPSKATLHKGFSNYANVIYDQLRPSLGPVCVQGLPYGQKAKPLWLAGHSLGGAVATILAERLAAEGCNVRGVVTLGSPKPGLTDFQRMYNDRTLLDGSKLGSVTSRWVHDQDPFPCLPPMNAWKHVGSHNTIDGNGALRLNDPTEECNSPAGALGKFKKAALGIGWALGINFAQAIEEWINDRIILQFLCNDDEWYDEIYTFGACRLVEIGTRLRDAYSFTPDDLITAIVMYAKNQDDHELDEYANGLSAIWDDAVGGPTGSVTVKIPSSVTSNPPTVYEEKSGDTCRAELDAEGRNWVCTFNPPLGGNASFVIPMTEEVRQYLYVNGCQESPQINGLQFRCVVSTGIDSQVYFYNLI